MIKPLRRQILVTKLKSAERTDGGLIIPEAARSPDTRAKIVSVGAEVKDLFEGQTVWLSARAQAHEVVTKDEKFYIVPDEYVIALDVDA